MLKADFRQHPYLSDLMISTEGEVYSKRLKRLRKISTGTHKSNAGYKFISAEGQKHRVHTLVLETFVSEKPEGNEALHLNGDRGDNRLENLRWGTHKENMNQMKEHGTHKTHKGEAHGMAKLTEDDVRYIRKHYRPGVNRHDPGNSKELAERFNLTRHTVWLISNNQSWTHID